MLSYVDEVLGNFSKFLSQNGLLDKALVVFTSDHGESLGEHGESTHGYFIYQSTLRVPLIFRWPNGSKEFLARVDEPASLLDVAPTLMQFAGFPKPTEFQGRSLLGSAKSNPPALAPEIYSESLYAKNHFGCGALQSLRLGRYKYIEAPKPELYDLAVDTGERQNLYALKKSLALSLKERTSAIRTRFQAVRPAASPALTPEAIAALNSLGYLAGGSSIPKLADSGPDPKDRIADSESYSHALILASSGRLTESNVKLRQLIAKYPEILDIRLSLAVNQQRQGMHQAAVQNFRQLLKRDPLNVLAHFDLAVSLFRLRQLDDAIKELQAALALEPNYTRAEGLLGTAWL